MWEPEDWLLVALVSLLVLGFAFLIIGSGISDKRYKELCTKSGGTVVFNGSSNECIGVKSISN